MGFIFIIVLVAIAILLDHIRYWRQRDYFLEISNSFACMYNIVAKSLKDGKDVSYESKYFNIEIKNQDYNKFWKYVLESITEVLDAYEQIDPRYLEQMDEETYDDIFQLHNLVKNINSIARNEAWKRGIDVHNIG